MAWPDLLRKILRAIPIAIDAIEAIVANWKGKEKEDAALGMIAGQIGEPIPPELEPQVRTLIRQQVAFMNKASGRA